MDEHAPASPLLYTRTAGRSIVRMTSKASVGDFVRSASRRSRGRQRLRGTAWSGKRSAVLREVEGEDREVQRARPGRRTGWGLGRDRPRVETVIH